MSNFGRPEEKSGVAFREGGKDNGGRTPTTKTALLPGSPSSLSSRGHRGIAHPLFVALLAPVAGRILSVCRRAS